MAPVQEWLDGRRLIGMETNIHQITAAAEVAVHTGMSRGKNQPTGSNDDRSFLPFGS